MFPCRSPSASPDLFSPEPSQQHDSPQAGCGEEIQQMRHERPIRDGRQHLGPVGDGRPKARPQAAGQDRGRHA